jgi:hypothetical protein
MTNLQKRVEAGVLFRKLLNGIKLGARQLASMGKSQGTLCISRRIKPRKCKLGMTRWAQSVLDMIL